MNKNLDLLRLYCEEYGMEIESANMWGVANSHFVVLPSSTTYVGMVTVGRLESMNEPEIENFVIKCALKEMGNG